MRQANDARGQGRPERRLLHSGAQLLRAAPAGFCQLAPVWRLKHWILIALVGISISGCGLTGGGIPPGPTSPGTNTTSGWLPGAGGSSGTATTPITVSGRVQQALPPYSPISNATVSVISLSGQTIVAPTHVDADGSFSLSNVAQNSLELVVTPGDPGLQSVRVPLQALPGATIQVVAALPPVAGAMPSAISLSADTISPSAPQTASVYAVLAGPGPPDLAPSWVAYGNAGGMHASGSIASFSAQSAGSETIFAFVGTASASLTFTVPANAGMMIH